MARFLPSERCHITGKISHPDEASARREAKFMRKRIGPKLKVYLCQYCSNWHIGHWRRPDRRGPSPLHMDGAGVLELKVIEVTAPVGYRVLYKNAGNRWERYSGQHYYSMDDVVAYLNTIKRKRFTVQYPHGGVSHFGTGWIKQ